jgi:hypothetical protein
MPRLPASFEMTCIHGPVRVKEKVMQGKKIDKKTGEEKNNYVDSGKMQDQYTFICGGSPVQKSFPEGTKLAIGQTYRLDKEIYLEYFNLTDAVLVEIKAPKQEKQA